MENKKMKMNTYNIGVFMEIEPRYSVATQLKILIPVGIPTKKVRKEKMVVATAL